MIKTSGKFCTSNYLRYILPFGIFTNEVDTASLSYPKQDPRYSFQNEIWK